MTTQPKRLPTMDEFKTIIHYMQQSWIFISDDNMYEMREIELVSETQELERIMTDITGNSFNVER